MPHLENTTERLDALHRLGLSPQLLALASERWPHPIFEFCCGSHVPPLFGPG